MDKTTTWLVRGAALVVIGSGVIGLLKFLEPTFKKANLSEEQKEKIAISKASERCKKFPILSKEKLLEMLENKQIKKAFYTPSIFQVNTKKGKYLFKEVDLLINLSRANIPIYGDESLTKKYNAICR